MNNNAFYNRAITAGLLIGLATAYGCDDPDRGESYELADREPVESAAPNEQNIIIVDEEFTEDPELVQELDLADASNESLGPPGKCCHAECYDGIDAWYQLWWISEDCTTKAKAWCYSHDWGLKDAAWLWC